MALAYRTEHISPFYVVQILSQVEQLERAGKDVIRLFVGEPDFDTPRAIEEAALEALKNQSQGYLASTGMAELKQKIAERYQRWHGIELDPARVIVTPGGSTALQMAFLATLNPGDEVLLPEPGYPCNTNLLHMVNAKGVPVNLQPEQGMALSLAALEAAITGKTKAILIASPSNPLGSVMSVEQWREISDFCDSHGLQLFADEIYHGITFEGLAPTALEVNQNAWITQSFSKFYGMTGWRLGWLVAPAYAVDACERIAQNLFLSSPALSQQCALAGFEPEVEQLCFDRVHELKARRDYLMQALPPLGLDIMANPDGAFYLYIDVSKYSDNALQFCEQLLLETGVAVTPGIDFGGPCPETSIRLAYTVGVERLQQAVERMAQYLSTLS
ncbi:aminotransferase class I/II-fold pyridoxal phosphate-dependent enzyme [Reinekea marinisedimentorum]|uniref:Aminotransferase n=1 Tax=Reinekea marinisedimentorum TaxID=230495 RepID=A0A4R3I8H6_9GAMM|nr:aminotransferase class I/II-fold pyridoxal phosphate-dependent enzyme [Reinekea marinisedimentorum]TCS41631.1 aspartate/methionine/tyrosine aminotransferase [Reinekea marinisedimentorum]